jgi:ABC-2 type transport system ATP-binding protein
VTHAAWPLRVEQAVKKFGDVPALAGATFDLGRGELLGLLGPNGAGKTTIIRAIAGRVRLDAGVVRLFGRALNPGDARPEVGVVPQELAIYPKLTAAENLEAFGRLNGVSGAALGQRVAWALEWSDLSDRAREPVLRFSGGMKRRLNIACSLVHEPTVVLLDEPTVGVDPQSRDRIYEMLGQLQRTGVSIVLTTHHIEEAERRCERIVIIDHGRIVAAGTPGELMRGTQGAARTVKIVLARRMADGVSLPDGTVLDAERRSLLIPVRDIGSELPAVLAHVARAGGDIADLHVAGGSLQDVFIALTGRELRD